MTPITKAHEENRKELLKINKEWEQHERANICSICDSPKQHTSRISHLTSSTLRILEATKGMIKKALSDRGVDEAIVIEIDELFNSAELEIKDVS